MEPIISIITLSVTRILAAIIYWLIMDDLIKGDRVLEKALKVSVPLFLLVTIPNYWFNDLFQDPIYRAILYTSCLWAIVGLLVLFCNFFRKMQGKY